MTTRAWPQVGSVWQHYKLAQYYKILAIARSTNNPCVLSVVYEAQYDDEVMGNKCVWTRPIEEFLSDVDGIPRFTLIPDHYDAEPVGMKRSVCLVM